MYYFLVYLNEVLGLSRARQCNELGFLAMYQIWVYVNNLLGLGIAQYVLNLGFAQQCIKISYILTMC